MKAAVIALTENLAMANARVRRARELHPAGPDEHADGDRDPRRAGHAAGDVIAARDRRVPLGRKMGTAWDVAYAALFLHSDEAQFITGISMRVDGGQSLDVPA